MTTSGEKTLATNGRMLLLLDIFAINLSLHSIVIRSAAALWRHPGDDLVRVRDVAGFAMHTVRWVQADAFAIRLRRVVQHLVNIGRTEVLAGAAEFFYAALVADIRVMNDEVRGLIFFVLRARVVEIGQLVESKLAVALCRPKDVGLRAAIRRVVRATSSCADTRRCLDSARGGRARP